MIMSIFLKLYISIAVCFWPVSYLERVISNTMKTGPSEKWEISLEDYFNMREVV